MKKLTIALLLLLCWHANAQTNVSGGVFSNTTWTLANSPYIVTANVVVFPGVTLTIEPGVTVKFDNGVSMEIRQSSLMANGTLANPIVFTSNNPNPVKGSWGNIYANQSTDIQVRNCAFHYAATGLTGQPLSLTLVRTTFTENNLGIDISSNYYNRIDSCIFRNNNTGMSGYQPVVTNSVFNHNDIGLYSQTSGSIINCVIDSNSTYGIHKHVACNDTIRNNEIKYNGAGIASDGSGCGGDVYIHHNKIENNTIGILLQYAGGSQNFHVHQNSICANTAYNIKNVTALSMNATSNCWCSTDLNYIASIIYDAYDDVSSGIVSFNPIDSLVCPMTGVGLEDISAGTFHIYPNPAKDQLMIETASGAPYTICVSDLSGRTVLNKSSDDGSAIDISQLAEGIYTLIIQTKENTFTKKLAIVR